jgi:arylsulfatase
MPHFRGETDSGPRVEKFYFTDDGSLSAFRYNAWKIQFSVQEAEGIAVWREPFKTLRAPLITNLRMDPFERAHEEGIGYEHFWAEHMFIFGPAAGFVGEFLATFQEFPPRQRPGSFTIDGALEMLYQAGSKGR